MNLSPRLTIKKPVIPYTLIICGFLVCSSCIKKKQGVFNTEQHTKNHLDTLTIGYSYWWPQTGPFIGNCGEPYSLVFTGTIKHLQKEAKKTNYTSRKGILRVDTVLTWKKLKNENYNEELYISSDCFYGLDISQGDQVIVFCYTYENNHTTPGGKSILKIKDNHDPIVQSIRQYIQSGQNPLSIKNDTLLWDSLQLGSELRQLISCKKHFLKK